MMHTSTSTGASVHHHMMLWVLMVHAQRLPKVPRLHHGDDQQPARSGRFGQKLLLPDRLDVNVLTLWFNHVL